MAHVHTAQQQLQLLDAASQSLRARVARTGEPHVARFPAEARRSALKVRNAFTSAQSQAKADVSVAVPLKASLCDSTLIAAASGAALKQRSHHTSVTSASVGFEAGSAPEVFRALHSLIPRLYKSLQCYNPPLLVLNCRSLPEGALLEALRAHAAAQARIRLIAGNTNELLRCLNAASDAQMSVTSLSLGLRLAPVDAYHIPKRSKFGMGVDEAVQSLYELTQHHEAAAELLQAIDTVHAHPGSLASAQLDELRANIANADKAASLLRSQLHTPARCIDIGGGMPSEGASNCSINDYSSMVASSLSPEVHEVILEPGRLLLANSACVLAPVTPVREGSCSSKTSARVHGHFSVFSAMPDAVILSQSFPCRLYRHTSALDHLQTQSLLQVEDDTCDEDGRVNAHVLAQPMQLSDVDAVDHIVFGNCGAYQDALASVAFNGFSPPDQFIM